MALTILIVGAGIGGLTAAIALGQQGHHVHLFEKSAFSQEVGAALHFGPHAHRVLKKLGVDIDSLRPCVCSRWHATDLHHKVLHTRFILTEKQNELGVVEDEIMLHRVDAHSGLRKHALAFPNVNLHLSSPTASVDPDQGRIVLEDGSSFQGDIVVGADGVHSKTIQTFDATDYNPYTIGTNMYRFMVDASKALESPSLKQFLDRSEYLTTHNTFFPNASTGASFLVMYPCREGSLLNLATFQPASHEKVSLGTSYTNPGTVKEVVDMFPDWPDHFKELAALAEDVKHWACVTAKPRTTFTKGRLVLIGDAAHPTLPTHGAGAGMAIEDAGVLGTVLDSTTQPKHVLDRLKLFNNLRYERATTVKCASEMLPDNSQRTQVLQSCIPDAEVPLDMEAFMWPVDVIDDAKKALEQSRQGRVNGSSA